MSELEWNKFVEKFARKIKVYGPGVDISRVTGTYGWTTLAKPRKAKRVTAVKVKPKKILSVTPKKVTYESKSYIYKNKVHRYLKIKGE